MAGRAKRYLIENFSVNVNAFDLLIGYRADDSYFDYAELFLNNGISVEQLARAMRLGKLGELGDVFDYAINTCGIPGNDFTKLFIASSVSKRMENGEPACLAGKSGIEIAQEIVAETKGQELKAEPEEHFGRSQEYWIGWAVAYYQWYSDRKYSDIFKVNSFEDLQKMYYTLHEADITKFADIVDSRMKEYNKASADTLHSLAKVLGCTMEDLIEK